jgi:hypothetical protein
VALGYVSLAGCGDETAGDHALPQSKGYSLSTLVPDLEIIVP